MTPSDYIKQVTGQLLLESNKDIEELCKAYTSSEYKAKAYTDRNRVKNYLKDCLKLAKQ